VSRLITLFLPLFNVFTIYRNVIRQCEDFDDAYSAFHSIVFYGEFIELHLLIVISLIYFMIQNLKCDYSSCPCKSRWIYFLDIQFTLMTFGMLKLIPIISTNGFTFLFTQINLAVPMIRKYSKLSQIILFALLILSFFFQFVLLFGLLILIILVRVYQLSFVGCRDDPYFVVSDVCS
jgi:hypothetical protein